MAFRFDIITLFPEVFQGLSHSMLYQAEANGLIEIRTHNLRNYGLGQRKQVDDQVYGGGAGMLLKVEPIVSLIEDIKQEVTDTKVVLLTPRGQLYRQSLASKLSRAGNLILICGHYEGVDERINQYLDFEISIGDYVLTGGEIPAMVLVDSVARLLEGVLGDPESYQDESHSLKMLEYPQYTRPVEYRGSRVPEVLLGGDHQAIADWRREQAIIKTRQNRTVLLEL
ncbi:tRNA (guanosine(37)-N1)-methyltransferase TrmD [Candidatus Saccharibacteria bacterium]|nr:tRNA (guanosine(37)-N1)-methyltransferase TrmD [Candidatus Saccharibacteria bacterium]